MKRNRKTPRLEIYLAVSIAMLLPSILAAENPDAGTRRAEAERHRIALARIDAEFDALRSAHQQRLKSCATAQCKFDEDIEFKKENHRLAQEKFAEGELHRKLSTGNASGDVDPIVASVKQFIARQEQQLNDLKLIAEQLTKAQERAAKNCETVPCPADGSDSLLPADLDRIRSNLNEQRFLFESMQKSRELTAGASKSERTRITP